MSGDGDNSPDEEPGLLKEVTMYISGVGGGETSSTVVSREDASLTPGAVGFGAVLRSSPEFWLG